ncbi:MAG: hypothetical protein ABIG44_14610 [Planctomycetota bacterium]
MQDIPNEVREYLVSSDGMVRQLLGQKHPDLKETLARPETRQAVLAWLASDEPWQEEHLGFTGNSLQYLIPAAAETEAAGIRPFLLHPHALVRRRAHEYFVTLYFPDKNPPALLATLQNMLLDSDDGIRTAGMRFVKRGERLDEFRPFLRRWVRIAEQRGWQKSESLEIATGLLKEQ